jgi:DNA-binding CsgD family transcriptional regulator
VRFLPEASAIPSDVNELKGSIMQTLSGADTHALLNSIGILSSDISSESLPERTLKSILTLIPNEMTAFDRFGADGDYRGSLWYSPAGTVSQESVQVLGEVIHDHPYFADAIRTPDEGTFRVSDFVSLNAFHKTSVYNEFYKQFGGDSQITCAVRTSDTSLVTCSILRPNLDFTDREYSLLKFLTPHLAAAFRNDRAMKQLANERRYLATAVNRGVIVIDGEGAIVFINRIAEELLETYFADFVHNVLPDALQQHIEKDAANIQGKGIYAPPQPFRIKRQQSELMVSSIFDGQMRELTLLFEERVERSPGELCCIGLTPREAEVLILMSRGKTDREIAILCAISVRTVQKHAEHLYVKLGVETRTAAVMAAMEKMDV